MRTSRDGKMIKKCGDCIDFGACMILNKDSLIHPPPLCQLTKNLAGHFVLSFGKYKNNSITLERAIVEDTEYITWCTANIRGFKLGKKMRELYEKHTR